MRPVLEPGFELLLDQEAAKARAVDEEIRAHLLAALQHHRFDEAVGAAQPRIHDLAFGAPHAARLGVAAQIRGIQTRVEVIGVGDVRKGRGRRHIVRGRHEFAERGGGGVQGVGADVDGLAREEQLQPILVKRQQSVVVADGAEAMNVAIPGTPPVDELDAELEGATHLADELDLGDLQHAVEELQVRYGGFAHPDGADLLGFDEANGAVRPQHLGEGGGRHPARGAAADDEDAAEAPILHEVSEAHPRTCSPPLDAAFAVRR